MIFLQHHHVILTLILVSIVSNVASALPTPDDTSSTRYKFLFNFMHGVSQNLFRIPFVRSFFGIQSNPTTVVGIEAKAVAQSVDPNVQGVTIKESK